MSIRKRKWTGKDDEGNPVKRQAWVADYFNDGKRHLKTFDTKAAAQDYLDRITPDIRAGTHTPDSASKTIGAAGDAWIAKAEADHRDHKLEYSTLRQYTHHLSAHIKPFVGSTKLSRLTGPGVNAFKETLRRNGRTEVTAKKVLTSLGSIIGHAVANGWTAKNPVKERQRDRKGRQVREHLSKEDIPSKAEVGTLIAKATGNFRPLLITSVFTGLRASELRGLTWDAVDLERGELVVRQRIDAWNEVGPPKTEAATRTVPLAPIVTNTLREWKLQCPRRKTEKGSELWLVFPNSVGKPENQGNTLKRHWGPLQVACGIIRSASRGKGEKATQRPRYRIHDLRHFAASIFIEQGMNPKRVQELMGHSSIVITYDLYGSWFPSPEADKQAMAEIQARVLG